MPAVEAATLRRILDIVRPYWRHAALVIACILGAATLNLAAPFFIKQIVDVAIPRGETRMLLLFCAAMVAGPVVAGLLQLVQKQSAEFAGQQVMLELRVTLYTQFHDMPFDFFAKQKPGEAVSHVLNDVEGVGGVISSTLVDLVENMVVLSSTFLFIAILDWRLALLAAAFLPCFVGSTRRVGRQRKQLKRALRARTSEFTGILTETLSVSGALLIKVFGREQAETRRVRAKLEAMRDLALRQSLVGRWFRMLLGVFESAGPALVFAVGGLLVIHGHAPLGTVMAFVSILKRLYGPASQLAGAHIDLKASYAYFDRIFEVMDRRPSIRNAEGAVTPKDVRGEISFANVTLAYDDADRAISDVTLRIPAGRTIGLVGPSGAGKSSLASLVMRLYDPTSGSVLVDGLDVRQWDISALRQQVAVVTQDTFLFHATIAENLRYAKASATLGEIKEAARLAQIDETIGRLPKGYETIVGERGFRFSAGERQRLAIARAILKNPRILILDEATSSLDAAAEQHIQEALKPLRQGRTSLIIAHRLSMVREADSIIVMNKGEIVEEGTHDELMGHAGLYAWLWRIQAKADWRPGSHPEGVNPDLLPVPAQPAYRLRR